MPIDRQAMSRIWSEDDGAVAVIVALTFVVLMGFVALGIDTASLYREQHKLQTITDLTALSAVPDTPNAQARATVAKAANGGADAVTETLIKGRYLRNPALAPEARFSPLPDGAPGINAVSVRLRDNAPLSFAQIFTEDDHVTLRSTALAARTGAVSFSLESAIGQIDGAALNALLGAMFETSISLSANDLELLAGASVSAGDLVQALSSVTGFDATNPAEILNATVSPSQVLSALRAVVPTSLSTALAQISPVSDGPAVLVSDIVGGIDTALGLTVIEFLDDLRIPAIDILSALAARSPSLQPVALETDAAVPGLLSQDTFLIAGEPAAQSGWIAMGEEGVSLHHAGVRLATDTDFAPNVLGPLQSGVATTRLNLPIYLEVAGASATLDQMSCSENPAETVAEFITASTPLHPSNGTSVAALYVGQLTSFAGPGSTPVNPADVEFADVLDLEITLPVPLLPDVTVGPITIQMRSVATLGQSDTARLQFSRSDITAGQNTQSFGSEALIGSGVASLMSPDTTEFRIKPGQDGLISGEVAGILETVMVGLPAQMAQALTGPIDTLLDTTLASAGVKLGAGQLTVEGLHCERARLVR